MLKQPAGTKDKAGYNRHSPFVDNYRERKKERRGRSGGLVRENFPLLCRKGLLHGCRQSEGFRDAIIENTMIQTRQQKDIFGMTKANDQKRLYKDLAWIWPIFSTPEEYAPSTRDLVRIIKKNSKIKVKTLLHLGSGAGLIDLTFKKYFRVTGVDLSRKMIAQARQLNPEVRYVQGDMRNVMLKQKFEAIIVPDSMDYLTSKNDIQKTIRIAHDHLRPGGVFLIVIEQTQETFKQNSSVLYTRKRGDVELTVFENLYDPDPKDSTCELTFIYLIRKRGKLTMETDRHLCGLFSVKVWNKLIREAGFKAKFQMYVAHPPETGRFPMFICQKPENT